MTNLVSFPGLGLEFTLNRVAFTLFGHNVYWYGIIIALGFILAVVFCCSYVAPRIGVPTEPLIDLLFFAVPLAVIGARAYYVIFYLDRFRTESGSIDWAETIRIWDGGLAIYGAVIAAAITLLIFCRVRKLPFLAAADVGVHGLFIGQLIGRWGNFMNVEAYGGVTELPWRMCSPSIAETMLRKGLVDSAGYEAILDGSLGVHPTFFYESVWNLAGLLVLILVGRRWRKFDGQMFLTYVAWYGLGRFFIEGLRTDSLYFFNTGLRVSQVLALASCVVAAGFLVYHLFIRPHSPEELYLNRGKTTEKEAEDHDPDGRKDAGGQTKD